MFSPYTIRHIQLCDVCSLAPPTGKHYLVFWYHHYPLGHIWYEKNLGQQDFRKAIIEAITPALNHYLESVGVADGDLWKRRLFEDDFASSTLNHQLAGIAGPKATTQTITVVICTRNRPNELKKCIEQLMRSHDSDFDLLVVDNASDTDETERVVAAFNDVKYVREERKGLDIARNTGIKYATNAIVAFTDDDVMVDADWITRIKEGFENPSTMALTGLTIPLEISTKAQYLFERDWGFNKGYLPKVFDHEYVSKHIVEEKAIPAWDVGAGANMAFRRDIFKVVGGFDERLDVGASGCSGDSEMWHRILAEGWNCFYMPQMVVYHQHRKSMPELKRQLFSYMKGHVSALMVQYEKYGHTGDLKRVKRELPKWYFHRIKSFLKTGNQQHIRAFFTEIRGCLAGWKFYKQNPVNRDIPLFTLPTDLPEIEENKANPLVSVVITCYNYGHYLHDAIESVRTQTHQHIQMIVVDDGSDDDTVGVCKSYPAVTYVKTARVGVSMARNTGLLYSKGDYVLFLDADDWLYPEALETQLACFRQFPESAFVVGGFDRADDNGTVYTDQPDLRPHTDDFFRSLLMGNFIGMQSNVLYRRELFFDFYFDSTLNGCEDYDLNLRISRCLPATSHLKKVAVYRVHANSLSGDAEMMLRQVLNALDKQKPFLRTEEEQKALSTGVENWNTYYRKLTNYEKL